uniref:Putative disease resistance protein RGA1 n=1 Tax=Aegilops tauschii TaxID=37682 RepID=M8B6T6_AEGTA
MASQQTKMTRMLPRLAIIKNAMAIQVQQTKQLVMSLQEESEYIRERTTIFQEIIAKRETGPVLEEAMILGRGPDKERIIAALLSTEPNIMQEHITILPIFGLAGIGKTTLAQMVFNDTHSLHGYDFRVWVHVSPQFDFHTIGKSIICNVSGRGKEDINYASSDMEGMESIMKRLHMLLDGKEVLLVLDDLWEEDPIQLQLLKSMLIFLGDKMDVIVTTCNQAIARKIWTVEPYKLNPLSDETCWEIIKKSIRSEAGEEELEKIGRKIASKCLGLPSAARKYARMLDSSRDAITWRETMETNIWSIIMNYKSTTFELSYRSMPPDLRLYFAYCCQIFPSGQSIVKDDLVHQWIALQLVEPSEILSATQIAEEHISRLQDLSFLQTAELDHILLLQKSGPDTAKSEYRCCKDRLPASVRCSRSLGVGSEPPTHKDSCRTVAADAASGKGCCEWQPLYYERQLVELQAVTAVWRPPMVLLQLSTTELQSGTVVMRLSREGAASYDSRGATINSSAARPCDGAASGAFRLQKGDAVGDCASTMGVLIDSDDGDRRSWQIDTDAKIFCVNCGSRSVR